MNLLVVTPKYDPDNFSINIIVNELISKGHMVTVLTSLPFDNDGYIDGYEYLKKKDHLTIYRLKVKRRKKSTLSIISNYLSFYFLSKRWVKRCKEKYDAVYTFNVSPVTSLAAGNLYKKKYKVKHVAHILDIWPASYLASGKKKESSLMYKILFKWSKSLYREVDQLLIGSKSFESYLKDVLKLENLNISYLPQPALYSDNKGDNPYIKDTFNNLYAGNIAKLQLVDFPIKMMNLINDKSIHLTIIGSGSFEDTIKEEINNNINKDNIHLYPQMDYKDVSRYYQYASIIFIGLDSSSSVKDVIPNKLITALAYGKIIVGMMNGDGASILKETSNYVTNQDINELKEVVEKVKSLGKKEIKIKEDNNRSYYLSHYSIEYIINNLLDSFSSK